MEPCANTAALNRYLSQTDAADRRETAIEEETARLLADEYSPGAIGNAGEAWSELLAEDCPEIIGAIILANQSTDCPRNAYAMLIGESVLDRVAAYWRSLARAKAEQTIENSCPYCFDAGCRHCEERPRDD